jgi:hypothetical protein
MRSQSQSAIVYNGMDGKLFYNLNLLAALAKLKRDREI